MEYIDFDSLQKRLPEIKNQFQAQRPFRFVMFENFFLPEKAEQMLAQFPSIDKEHWDGTTYINQKNKFQQSQFEQGSLFQKVFGELNHPEFLSWLENLTEIEEPLLADEKLFGGGLHQSINGAFLNVHVDYNIHPETKFHRRLNVLVFMNKDWKSAFGGQLELWDFSNGKKDQLASVSPDFNRCVIFETNEISFHGHPKALNLPTGMSRKSLATYYYTKSRPKEEINSEHNTIYVNTEGLGGKFKQLRSGLKAFIERAFRN